MKITFDPVFVVHNNKKTARNKKNTSIFIFTTAKKSTVAGGTERADGTGRMKRRISTQNGDSEREQEL